MTIASLSLYKPTVGVKDINCISRSVLGPLLNTIAGARHEGFWHTPKGLQAHSNITLDSMPDIHANDFLDNVQLSLN